MELLKRVWPILAGLIALGLGIYMLIDGYKLFERCTEEITATIVQIEKEAQYDEDYGTIEYYYPVIEYKVNGEVYSGKSSSGFDVNKYKVGQKIKIFYNPNSIDEFIISKDKTSSILGVLCIVGGIIFLTGGIISFMKKQENE